MGPWLCSHGRGFKVRFHHGHAVLQWGRGFAATEGAASRQRRCTGLDASMGPWLCSHGRLFRLWSWADRHTQLQWGRGFAATEGRRAIEAEGKQSRASMGPWLCSHGRLTPLSRSTGTGGSLQWGRGFAATEGSLWFGTPSLICTSFNGAVALQPRKGRVGGQVVAEIGASMGPWLCSHGR